MSQPPHHGRDGRFRAPWPEASGDHAMRGRFARVVREWITTDLPPDPEPSDLPTAEPEIASPAADPGELRITWVGHATFLLQLPGLNLLTDPIWSTRPSPVPVLGTPRFVPAVPDLAALPPIHGVLLSHDHYDHLDRPTVRALHRRYGDALTWYAPLGFDRWLGRLGITSVRALDWWEEAEAPDGTWTLTAAPARHWCRRAPWDTNRRLWCSWAIRPHGSDGPRGCDGTSGRDGTDGPPANDGPRVYFGGDSAYMSVFEEIGRRLGPFDASLIPIGAYDPRWFMKASHMNPEEAVRAYRDLGGRGAFVPTHWGTFRLTFEDPLEPPRRLRSAWAEEGLPPEDLAILRHGQTLKL